MVEAQLVELPLLVLLDAAALLGHGASAAIRLGVGDLFLGVTRGALLVAALLRRVALAARLQLEHLALEPLNLAALVADGLLQIAHLCLEVSICLRQLVLLALLL